MVPGAADAAVDLLLAALVDDAAGVEVPQAVMSSNTAASPPSTAAGRREPRFWVWAGAVGFNAEVTGILSWCRLDLCHLTITVARFKDWPGAVLVLLPALSALPGTMTA